MAPIHLIWCGERQNLGQIFINPPPPLRVLDSGVAAMSGPLNIVRLRGCRGGGRGCKFRKLGASWHLGWGLYATGKKLPLALEKLTTFLSLILSSFTTTSIISSQHRGLARQLRNSGRLRFLPPSSKMLVLILAACQIGPINKLNQNKI